MAASTNVVVSRKPSDSSNHSNSHSPTGSPANSQPPRRLTPSQAGTMLGIGMAASSQQSRQLKSLGPGGWPVQVWSGAPKRNVSGSTATSVAERSSSHGDSGYRSLSESGWRSSGGTWEGVASGAVLSDPIQYDSLAQPGARSRQPTSSSPSAGFAMPRVSAAAVDTELARSLRGLTTEDDFGTGRSPQRSPRHGQGFPSPQFPQADYASYQGGVPAREAYGEYAFPYDAYRPPADPAVYAASPALSHAGAVFQSAGGFYDFSAPAVHPAGFYFTSPIVQHAQMAQPAMMYPSPLTSSPRMPLARPEYSPQLPMMVPVGTVYPSLNPTPLYAQAGTSRERRRPQPAFPQATQARSALLEDFRANKIRRWELRDILGHAVEFSADQHGSRFMQHRYEAAAADVKQKIFDEIVPEHVQHLMQDVFGNYVIQKLFEHGTMAQKALLVAAMEGSVLSSTLQMYGCRVIQKAIENITPEQQSVFVAELEPHIMRCVKDANGNHVVQKLIERVPVERLTFIKAFQGSVYELASHPYGCRVLQRCLENLGPVSTRPLLDELQKYASELMQDQFGNYVVQFLLENGEAQDRVAVINKLRGQMLAMARHKFASNVVEKALVTADSDTRRQLIEELMRPQTDGTNPIVVMMKDQYANYVLQRAMTVAEGQQQQDLAMLVRPQLVAMRRVSSVYTKHLNSIERCLNKVLKTTGIEA